ncbi:MAG: MBL fold metallo-hydrolase [Ardenticatenaceae bacterium]
MRRERVSEDIYIFTSEMYAQVTASVILTNEGAIVIDTLPFPVESRELAEFVYRRHRRGARYIINTHYHADHVYGNYLFPEAQIISHRLCRDALASVTEQQLKKAKSETPALSDVRLRIPTIVFDNEMGINLGNRSLRLIHLPGHSPDGVGVYVDGERILFAGDAIMPIPYFGQGDHGTLRRTLQRIMDLKPENIIQGHGDTLLRGEITSTLERHIEYLDCIEQEVKQVIKKRRGRNALKRITLEQCGESSIPLDGLVRHLHQTNLTNLYNQMKGKKSKRRK